MNRLIKMGLYGYITGIGLLTGNRVYEEWAREDIKVPGTIYTSKQARLDKDSQIGNDIGLGAILLSLPISLIGESIERINPRKIEGGNE